MRDSISRKNELYGLNLTVPQELKETKDSKGIFLLLHGDVIGVFLPVQVMHAADVSLTDFAGEFELIAETFDHFLVDADLGL